MTANARSSNLKVAAVGDGGLRRVGRVLALGHDRWRRSLALADLCASREAENCQHHCRSNRDLFHRSPHPVNMNALK
jgi:hypothetical protein